MATGSAATPMPLRRTQIVTFVQPLPERTRPRRVQKKPAPEEAPTPAGLRVVLDTKTGKRRASRSPRVVRKQPRRPHSGAPRLLRVHNRFVHPATKSFMWEATVERGGRKLLEQLTEGRARAMILAQTRRGLDQPEYDIARMGPRMSLGGAPRPGEEGRYVFWKGFDRPTFMREKDLPASVLA